MIQRFGSALNLNLHYHCLVTDGVFLDVDDGEGPEFYPLAPPSESELESIAWATCRKVVAKLKREGYWQDEGEGLVEPEGDERLSESYEASIRGVIQFGPQAGRRLAKVFAEVAECRAVKGPSNIIGLH